MDIRYILTPFLLVAATAAHAAPPVASTDTRTVPANVSITINVLSNDYDPDGDAIRLLPASVTDPANGRVVVNNDGGIQYIPDAGFTGQDRFLYTIVDDSDAAEEAQGEVVINVVPATLSSQTHTSNSASVAQSIDAVCGQLSSANESELGAGSAELAERCEALQAMAANDPQAAPRAVEQIAPEETLTLSKVGANASEFQAQVVGNRLMQLGQGISTASGRGLSWSGNLAGGAAGEESIFSRIGVFASLQLEDAEKDRTDEEAGFQYTANGITAGADYAVSSDWFIGGALGWTGNELDYNDDGGGVDSSIFTFIGYSTYHYGNFNFDVQLGYGGSEIDISRHIQYGEPTEAFDVTTEGSTSGDQWFLTLQSQYLYSHQALSLYPSAAFTYTNSHVDGYADNDAGGWEVVLGEQNAQQFQLQTGVQGTYAINTSWGVFIPNVELNLVAELHTEQDEVTGYFAFAPDDGLSFNMEAEQPDSLYSQLGFGFSVILPRGVNGYAGYRRTLGYNDYSASQFQAGFRMEF